MISWLANFIVKKAVNTAATLAASKMVRNYVHKKYNLEELDYPLGKRIDWKNLAWFGWLSRYAYKGDDEIKHRYEKFSSVYINEIDKIKYIVLVDDIQQRYYVSIRGTDNSNNVLQDINYFKDKSERLGINIHTGFHRASEKISDDLIQNMDKTYDVYLTGHSAGGAMALVVGWYLKYHGFKVCECITFGQPKVTDIEGTRMMNGYISLTRVVNETDIVPMVPPAGTNFTRYAHTGDLVILLDGGKYANLYPPYSTNFGVNSFWLFVADNDFSLYKVGKELPDHYMDNYHSNIETIITNGEEVPWKIHKEHLD